MFTGFNREVRNSLRVAGLRISYVVAAVQIAAEQYGAAVAANIALRLASRGTSDVELWASSAKVLRANLATIGFGGNGTHVTIANELNNFSNGVIYLTGSGTGYGLAVGVGGGSTKIFPMHAANYIGGLQNWNANASPLMVRGGDAAGPSGNLNGGDLRLAGGPPFNAGVRGVVALGYDGTNVSRVTVRNTILGLNGYTSSAADPTTTDLATAGDYGIHKNTTSGTVYLAFNDGGTIKKVALA